VFSMKGQHNKEQVSSSSSQQEALKAREQPIGNEAMAQAALKSGDKEFSVSTSQSFLALSMYSNIHLESNARLVHNGNVNVIIQQANDREQQSKQTAIKEWQLPAVLSYYVERSKLQEVLTHRFNHQEERAVVVLTALSGLGGIGKTQLANYYIHHASHNYSFKAWFKADSKEILEQQYWQLAQTLELIKEKDTSDQAITRLKTWFIENPDWLLVYDNVESYGAIYPLLPERNGHILMTSRNANDWLTEQQLEVSSMLLEEGRLLVQKLCGQQGDEVDGLLERLGYLPLAIVHAASYMRTKRMKASVYLRLYEKRRLDLLQEGKLPPEDKHPSLLVTWRLNREALLQENPRALEILEYCGFLNPSQIPCYLLLLVLSIKNHQEDTLKIEELFGSIKESLLNYSLITISSDNEMVSVHPLLQEFIRNEAPEDKVIFCLHLIVVILEQASQEQNFSMAELYRRQKLLPHLLAASNAIDNCLAIKSENSPLLEPLKATLLVNAGLINALIGDTYLAKEQYECALIIQKRHYGLEHINVAETLNNLSNVYNTLGDVYLQKALLEEALLIKEKHYGQKHVTVANTLSNLATAYGTLGDFQRKKVLLERVLAIEEGHYGKEHVVVSKTLNNLADAYGALGYNRQKKALLERALAIQQRHYEPEHVDMAKTLYNLATVCGALDDIPQKKVLLEKALVIQKKHEGKTHLETVRTLYDLGLIYYLEEDFNKASALIKQALTIIVNYPGYGKHHPHAKHIQTVLDGIIHQQLKLSTLSRPQPTMLVLDDLVKKYKLANTHQASLEKGLRSAVASGYLEDVKLFIEQVQNINAQDANIQSHKTALHWAVIKQQPAYVQLLLAGGANPLLPDARSMNAIQLAKQNNDVEILALFQYQLLLKYNLPQKNPASLAQGLRLATMRQQVEDMQQFILHLEHVNIPDRIPHLRRTALYGAVIKKNLICVKLLLAAGANPEIADAKNVTSLQLAIKTGDTELLALFGITLEKNKPQVGYLPLLPSDSTLHADVVLGKADRANDSLTVQINMNLLSNNNLGASSQMNVGDIYVDTGAIAEIIQQKLVFDEQKAASRNQLPLIEWGIPPELPYFVGRPLLHEQIKTHFKDKENTKILTLTALSGLGGIGKTQLANHYIHSSQIYSFKAWFKADTPETLQQEYWSLAQGLKLVEEKDTIGEVIVRLHRWLQENSGWLLVYDNVKDKRDVYDLLPKHGGHLLITSRSGNSWLRGEQVEITAMSLKEAQALVEKICGQQGAEVDALLDKLGYLPLAIVHAANYMLVRCVNANDYLELYEKQRVDLLEKEELPPEDKHQPLLMTWQLIQQVLMKEKPKALRLIEYCALLHHNYIPAYVLELVVGDESKVRGTEAKELWGDIKKYLLQYSLISITHDNQFISIHPLLQEFIVAAMKKIENYQSCLIYMANILILISQAQNASMADIYRRQKLLSHLLAISAVIDNYLIVKPQESSLLELLKIPLLGAAGLINALVGNFHVAKEQLECVVAIKKQIYGSEHVEVAKAMMNLSTAYYGLGDARQAQDLLEKALVIQEQHYGSSHVAVAITLINLATACGHLGDSHRKKTLLEKALMIHEGHYGPEHIETVRIMMNLATAYGDLGDTLQAKMLLEKALVIEERYYGREHVEVARILHNLANVYDDAGQKKTLLEEALAIKERHYGSEHVEVAKTLHNLAVVYGALSEAQQKKALLQKVLVTQERYYGPEHVEVARTLCSLADAYGAIGDIQQAKILLERALPIQEKHYAHAYPETAITLYNLGRLYWQENHLDKAKTLIERALAIIINCPYYGKQHPHISEWKKSLDTICQMLVLSPSKIRQSSLFTLAKKNKLVEFQTMPAENKSTEPPIVHSSNLSFQFQQKEITTMPLLDKIALAKQKKIFENVLVEELMQEVQYIFNVLAERAPNRKDFAEKAIELVTSIISKAFGGAAVALPLLVVGQVLTEVTADAIDKIIEHTKEKKLTVVGDLFYAEDMAKVRAIFRRLAKVVSLRYEYLIAVVLSEAPEESVLPLARTGARRLMEYLVRISHEIASQSPSQVLDFPLDMDVLLDGFIQGHSGRWVNTFFENTHLKARVPSIKKLSAEGAYGRSAMRIMPHGQLSVNDSKIYHREKALHQQQGKDKSYDWGRVKYNNDDKAKGPKYGFMYVSKHTTEVYGYHTSKGGAIFSDEIAKQLNYYPTVKTVGKDDILEYNHETSESLKENKPTRSFIEFIKEKYEKTTYPNYRIDTVWVKDADLSGEHLLGGNYDGIDFSACHFNSATFEKCSFARANFSFLTMEDLTCKEVIFDQADFNYAHLQRVTLIEPVSCIGTQWEGVNLEELKTVDENSALISAIQEQQKEQVETIKQAHEALTALENQMQLLEIEVGQKYKTIGTHLDKVDATAKKQAKELKRLAKTIYQEQINVKRYQLYLEQELPSMKNTLKMYGEEQAAIKEEQNKAIAGLEEQVAKLQLAKEKYDPLIAELQSKLENTPILNKDTLQRITEQMTKQYDSLKAELQKEMMVLKERVDNVEKEIEGVKEKMDQQHRQKFMVTAYSDNKLGKGAKLHGGNLKVSGFVTDTPMTSEDREMVKPLLQMDLEAKGYSGNILDEESEMKTGDTDIAVIRNEQKAPIKSQQDTSSSSSAMASSSSSVGSPITHARNAAAPATALQKQKLQEAKVLLDTHYPETEAEKDEEIRKYRDKILAILQGLRGRKLKPKEEKELEQVISVPSVAAHSQN